METKWKQLMTKPFNLSMCKFFSIIEISFKASLRSSFAHLRVLALSSCNIRSWAQLQLLEPLLPAIEELYLANNQLTDLPRREAELAYEAATGNVSEPVDLGMSFDFNVCCWCIDSLFAHSAWLQASQSAGCLWLWSG